MSTIYNQSLKLAFPNLLYNEAIDKEVENSKLRCEIHKICGGSIKLLDTMRNVYTRKKTRKSDDKAQTRWKERLVQMELTLYFSFGFALRLLTSNWVIQYHHISSLL